MAKALDRLAERIPVMPGEEDPYYVEARPGPGGGGGGRNREPAPPGPDAEGASRLDAAAAPVPGPRLHLPGCGPRLFTHAHHVVWWEGGGRTDLDNLVLVCSFHHKLVHEYGWSLERDPDGTVRRFRADGTGYRAGPGSPAETNERQPVLAAVGL